MATRTSAQPSGARSAMANGRLSSSSLASTTPSTLRAGIVSSCANNGPVPATGSGGSSVSASAPGAYGPKHWAASTSGRRLACSARNAGDRSTNRYRNACRQRGRERHTSRARRPSPAPASITTNGSAHPSASHSRSSARPTSAPNSEPTWGLVTKSRSERPAPPPRVKKPPRPYSACSMNWSNGIGPFRSMSAAISSAAFVGAFSP